MKKIAYGAIIAVLALSGAAAIQASIRVNGNQLMEGSGELSLKFRQSSTAAPSQAPPRIIYSLGQGIIADGQLPDSGAAADNTVAFRIGIGLGYDIAAVVYDVFCPITMTGDMNVDGVIDTKDVLLLVEFVYKDGEFPQPCMASGDVNCSGNVSSADVIYLVDYSLKGGPEPCDVCDLIPSVWTCP